MVKNDSILYTIEKCENDSQHIGQLKSGLLSKNTNANKKEVTFTKESILCKILNETSSRDDEGLFPGSFCFLRSSNEIEKSFATFSKSKKRKEEIFWLAGKFRMNKKIEILKWIVWLEHLHLSVKETN